MTQLITATFVNGMLKEDMGSPTAYDGIKLINPFL